MKIFSHFKLIFQNPHKKSIDNFLNPIVLIKNNRFLIYPLIILISFFYLFNISDGHDWGGDFSMYIMNAKNLVNRTPYNQTGYIYNEEVVYGPSAYPPIFPLLLTPFISFWGINLKILKIPGILCFITFLFYFSQLRNTESICFQLKILLIIMIGLYPFFFLLSESVLSEFTFILLSIISLDLINRTVNKESINFKNTLLHFLLGFFIALAYGTRTIGIVLFLVHLLLTIIKLRKISSGFLLSTIFSFLLIWVQYLLVPQTGDYFDFIPNSVLELLTTIFNSSIYYFSLFFGLFQFENFIFQSIFFIVLIEFFVIGFIHQVKQGISSFEIFFILYIGVLLVWPSYQFLRFLVPVIPLYFLYIIIGLEKIIRYFKYPTLKITIPLLLVALVCFNYIDTYMSIFPRPISDIEKVETQELFQYIKHKTNSEDVIIFFKPRVLALFTEKKSVAMAFPDPNGDEFSRMKDFGVTIAILRKGHNIEHPPGLDLFIKNHHSNFELIYNNSEFFVYKVIY